MMSFVIQGFSDGARTIGLALGNYIEWSRADIYDIFKPTALEM